MPDRADIDVRLLAEAQRCIVEAIDACTAAGAGRDVVPTREALFSAQQALACADQDGLAAAEDYLREAATEAAHPSANLWTINIGAEKTIPTPVRSAVEASLRTVRQLVRSLNLPAANDDCGVAQVREHGGSDHRALRERARRLLDALERGPGAGSAASHLLFEEAPAVIRELLSITAGCLDEPRQRADRQS